MVRAKPCSFFSEHCEPPKILFPEPDIRKRYRQAVFLRPSNEILNKLPSNFHFHTIDIYRSSLVTKAKIFQKSVRPVAIQ